MTMARGMPTGAHSSHSIRGGAVDAVGRGDHEQGRVGRAQPRAQVADEVRVAGGVEQVHLHVADLNGGEGQVHRA